MSKTPHSLFTVEAPGGHPWLVASIQQVLIWLPVEVMALYLKLFVVRYEGEAMTLISLGRPETTALTLPERLSFFRAEIWFGALLAPLLLTILARLRGVRLQRCVLATIGVCLTILANVQLEAFKLLGVFQPWDLLYEGLQWAYMSPGAGARYGSTKATLRVVSLILMVILFALLPPRLIERFVAAPMFRFRRASYVCAVFGVALCVFSWLPWLRATPYHQFALARTLTSLYGGSLPEGTKDLLKLTSEQLREEYRKAANAPAPPNPPQYFGRARGYDVVLFVIETMPAACVSFDSSLERFPNLASLKWSAWVGSAHYSTYPVTIRALFSILTGMYPPESSRDMLTLNLSVEQGLIHSLNRAGYETAVFGSSISIVPRARETFDHLGFKKIVTFGDAPTTKDPAENGTEVWARHQMELDRGALAALKQNIGHWTDSNQRYVAVYLPLISHGPWADLERGGQERDLMKRGQGLVVLLDQWLGEILEVLREKGRLERTLIVVTGDHGLRSWVEAPDLLKNLMDDYAFHVPFLLYAPGVLDHSERIPYMTSHIDLTPSILDLLGIAERREMEHGGLLWDPRLESRRVYFWANLYQGNDGMYDESSFYGWNRTADIVYSSPQMHFGPNEAQPDNSAAYRRATESILRMEALRFAWFRSRQAAASWPR